MENSKIVIPPEIEDMMKQVSEYVADNDWIVIKTELVRHLPAAMKTNFSRRDAKTKKQRTNDFERAVARRWEELTGVTVVFKHDETK